MSKQKYQPMSVDSGSSDNVQLNSQSRCKSGPRSTLKSDGNSFNDPVSMESGIGSLHSTSSEHSLHKAIRHAEPVEADSVGLSLGSSTDSAYGSFRSSSSEHGSTSSSSSSRFQPVSEVNRLMLPSLDRNQQPSSNTGPSSDLGYASVKSNTSSSSPNTTTPPSSSISSEVPPNVTEPFEGTAEEFFTHLTQTLGRWTNWNPLTDVREKLSESLLKELRELLWEQDADCNGDFEALAAAREGDENVVALAVFVAKNHKLLNTANKDRQTILHMAAQSCSVALVRLIITRGADGSIPDVYGDTALHIAAQRGAADVIKALTTTLTKSEVKHPYYRVPYKSLPQDNVQLYNHDGRAPVHLAAEKANSPNHQAALKALHKHAKADLDYRRLGDGYAPAHIAIDNEDVECLKLCLELGSDSEVRNFKSETPQQLAFLCNFDDMVILCQKYGAGKFQLEFAETESVVLDEEEDMDVDEASGVYLSQKMDSMTFE